MGVMRGWGRSVFAASLFAVAGAAVGQQKDELQFAETHVALPGEIEAMAAQLTELGPGLWESSRGTPPRLFLSIGVVNRAGEPRAFVPFRLAVRSQIGVEALAFDCSPERGQNTAAVLRGQRVDFLCRAESPGRGTVPSVASLVEAIKGRPELIGIQLSEVRRPPSQPRVQAGVPAAPPVAQQAPSQDATPARTHGVSSFESRLFDTRALQLRLLVVLALGYFACAKAIGNSQARIFFWILGISYIGSVIAREGIGTGLERLAAMVAIMFMLVGAVALPAAFHVLFTFVTADRETQKQWIIRGLLAFVAAVFMVLLG